MHNFERTTMSDQLRLIPSVDKIIADERMAPAMETLPHDTVVALVRDYLAKLRAGIASGSACPDMDGIARDILRQVDELVEPSLRSVINATGVILHTNLGRSLLSDETVSAMESAARNYTNLELDLASGKRGLRHDHVERLLVSLTGAEAAVVVNNNASAVLIALAALAKRKEVVVSRGQAVEIGGKFRIPDVMQQSGAKLKEVGTTNRTYIADYEAAISERTAALLSVHRSNFMTVGFTHDVELEEMVALAREHGVHVIHDLGSGCLIDTAQFGLISEPTVQQSIEAGADIACFSGDKLLGGPQAGIVVGKKDLIAKMRNHPLSRAMRIDKLCLAGLAATLTHYAKGEAISKVPLWQMVSAGIDGLKKRASDIVAAISADADIVEGVSTVGAGSIPGSTLPTWLVAIKSKSKAGLQDMVRRLRTRPPCIIGRIEKDTLYLDMRTILPRDDAAVSEAINVVVK